MSAVYKAIQAVMQDLSKVGIGKDRTNTQQNFKFRGVDEVMNALAPILSKHGLMILPRVTHREVTERLSSNNKALFYVALNVEFDFVAAEDGSKHTVGPLIGEAMDSGDKASNKAMSIAYKYACLQSFCIPTEGDNDPDATTHDLAPEVWDGSKQIDFGRKEFKGSPWRDAPDQYVQWIYGNPNLPIEHKRIAERELKRRKDESAAIGAPQ
jgi:ERF superfamily